MNIEFMRNKNMFFSTRLHQTIGLCHSMATNS